MKVLTWVSIVIFLLGGLALAWYLLSPLWFDEVVDEELPAVSAERTAPMSDEDKRAMGEVMAEAAARPDNTMNEPMMAGHQLLRQGAFTGADAVHEGRGRALLYELEDERQLVRLEDFRVTNGPELVVLLAKHPAPQSASQVKDDYLKLADLKGNVGNQNYLLPPDIDTSRYGSVVIWCELFGVLFASAPLHDANGDSP